MCFCFVCFDFYIIITCLLNKTKGFPTGRDGGLLCSDYYSILICNLISVELFGYANNQRPSVTSFLLPVAIFK